MSISWCRTFLTSPPQFPLFDVPDAIVTLPDDRAQNMVETIDGVQYAGIRRTYAVIPEASGTFTLPPVVITFGYSQDGKPVAGENRVACGAFHRGGSAWRHCIIPYICGARPDDRAILRPRPLQFEKPETPLSGQSRYLPKTRRQ